MKLDKLVGDRFKERPSDCQIDSHAIMVRGGYIKYMANGIFSSYAPTKRITKKIEQIIREEMDKIDGQEVQFPVVMPASLWQESGRYESIGSEPQAAFSSHSDDPAAFIVGLDRRVCHQQLDTAAKEQLLDSRFDFIDIIQGCVFMTGKFHVFVSCNGFHNCKQVACAHGDAFFGSSIASVVAENTADQTSA